MRPEYYAIKDIRFTKRQMWWLIRNLYWIEQGLWPEPPEGYTGYYDPGIPTGRMGEPGDRKILEISAEVKERLEAVIPYISGWRRRRFKVRRDAGVGTNLLKTTLKKIIELHKDETDRCVEEVLRLVKE